MIKNLLFIICIFVFSGCLALNSKVQKSDFENIENANLLKCKIVNYKRINKTSYVYEFVNLQNNKKFIANSDKYYYNSDDIVYVNIVNKNITNMVLIERKNGQISNLNNEKINKKYVKKLNIAVPKLESIDIR